MAYNRNLIDAGHDVSGHDIQESRCELFDNAGGKVRDTLDD